MLSLACLLLAFSISAEALTPEALSTLLKILEKRQNDPPQPIPPSNEYPWCIKEGTQLRPALNSDGTNNCFGFLRYVNGSVGRTACSGSNAFDWNICGCTDANSVDQTRCLSKPSDAEIKQGQCGEKGAELAATLGCKQFWQHSGSTWFKKSCPAGLLFSLSPSVCACDWPRNVDSTCHQSAGKRLLDLLITRELVDLL